MRNIGAPVVQGNGAQPGPSTLGAPERIMIRLVAEILVWTRRCLTPPT